jgi:hypothetical protein
MIDRFVRAARQRRYEVRPPEGDSGGEDLYFPLGPGPRIRNLSGVGRASTGLALRIRARLERRDFALARAEIGAVFGVGELMWRNETRYWGLVVARSLLRDGARELKRYAELTRDPVAAAQAGVIEGWSSSQRRPPFYSIFAYPDTAMVIAADTSLPRGLRAEAIVGGVQGAALSPLSRMIWGPPHWALRAVRALESDADPYVARAALIGDSTLTKLDRMGMYGRARLLLRLAREH